MTNKNPNSKFERLNPQILAHEQCTQSASQQFSNFELRIAFELRFELRHSRYLGQDLGHNARADGAAAFADGEANSVVHGDGHLQLDTQPGVVARHAHFGVAHQRGAAGHVGRAEVKLRTVAAEERRVPAAFFLRQHVHLALELGVRRNRAGLWPAPGRARFLRA